MLGENDESTIAGLQNKTLLKNDPTFYSRYIT
jgi:hypothetical protein